MGKKARIFNLMQYEFHPQTGEPLLSEDTIIAALSHKSFKEWAYILHDNDVYSADDQEQDYQYIKAFYECTDAAKEKGYLAKIMGSREDRNKMPLDAYVAKYQTKYAGQLKPRHWHVVARSASALDVDVVARWFGVEPQYIQLPMGQGAFNDCVEYLVHEGKKAQEQGKYHYDDSAVKANFDFRKIIDEMHEKRLKYGKDISEKDEIRHRVLYEGLSISELCSTVAGQLAYQEDATTLDRFRLKYIQNYAPMPAVRVNYYVCGKGGDGKNLMCRALARALCPEIPPEREQDIFFEVGANQATFDGYDGQPVVIWNDFRAGELLKVLGGRGNVFKVFDMFPSGRGRQNIKYGSVTLTNRINIVNSVQDYKEFLDGLAGDYKKQDGTTVELAEDRGQSYRRFPFIIPIHESDFDLLMNRGVFAGTREYEQYIQYTNIRGSMKQIASALAGQPEKRRAVELQTVQPVIKAHKQLVEKTKGQMLTDAQILEQFGDYGTMGNTVYYATPEPVDDLSDFVEILSEPDAWFRAEPDPSDLVESEPEQEPLEFEFEELSETLFDEN